MDIQTKKILIIEDELVLLKAIENKMTIEGYNIVTALDGEDGLAKIQKEKPDLILLDIILPKKNGFEILERMQKIGDKTPVIIISNSGQPVEIDRAMALGIKDYLVKTDFTPDDVLEKVEKIIGSSNHQKEGVVKNSFQSDAPDKNGGANNSAEPQIPLDFVSSDFDAGENINVRKNKILIVEDDKFLRELVAQKLNKEGLTVSATVTAEEALVLLKKERFHLILLDIILPGMSGFDFLKQIKTNPNLSDIPVVILSNLGEEKDKKTATALGAKSFMVKAMHTPNDIVDEIKKVLQQSYI